MNSRHSQKSLARRNHKSARVNNLALTSVLLLAIAVYHCTIVAMADSEPGSSAQSSGDSSQPSDEQSFAPKRQYFITPRIGRSVSGTPRAIWSSLEEASLIAPGQIQPVRGYPGPLKSSLLFLLGNRRSIGPRSASGLLPQARIGRRASPSGLLPQPRVGRRSSSDLMFEPQSHQEGFYGDEMASLDGGSSSSKGQQEIATAATSDNAALNDAVESLLGGR